MSGGNHNAESFDEVQAAYDAPNSKSLRLRSGWTATLPHAQLEIDTVGWSVRFSVTAADQPTSDALVEAVRGAFPLKDRYVFISYDTTEVGFAFFVQDVLQARVGPDVSIFVAKRDIAAGANPLKVMLEDQLLKAEALVAMCSRRSKGSPWLWWEASAVWAKSGLVVPLFIDVNPAEFGGPLTQVAQGLRLHDQSELLTAIRAVVAKVSPGRPCHALTRAEQNKLARIGVSPDASPLEILFEPSAPFVQDDFDPSLGSLRRVGVRNTTDQTLHNVEILLSDFKPQGASFLPIRLVLMHDVPQPFELHPGETQYADLVWYQAVGPNPNHLVLRYEKPTVPNMIPRRRYKLTVKTVARDVKARQRSFVVDIDDEGRLLLSPETPTDAPNAVGRGSGSGSKPRRRRTPTPTRRAKRQKKARAPKTPPRKKGSKRASTAAKKRPTRRR
jgi:hypothetical protein